MSEPKSYPAGSPEALAEYRRVKAEIDAKLKAGRDAILGMEHSDDFGPPRDGTDEDDDDDFTGGGEEGGGGEGGGSGEGIRRYRGGIRHQKINDDGLLYWATLGPVGDDCPVTPLGRDGKIFFFLTPGGQLVAYEDGKFGQSHLEALFAGKALTWLINNYPALSPNGLLNGFKANYARMALFSACDLKGVFDPREKVRGLGCWRGPEGELIQHLGDQVLIGEDRHDPGEIGKHVYPGRSAVAPPLHGDGIAAAMAVYADFSTWSWARGSLDARLLLGWIGCAIMGGALDWRPMVFITGDAGSGKSTVQERLKKLLPGRLLATVDASPAALRQMLNQDATAVSFDEIEADMNSDQGVNVIKLARVSASGGEVYRGGKDHNASEFTLRSCFVFSGIVPPSMRGQDLQRLSFLRLQPLPKGARPERITDATLKGDGQQLAGRIADGWARWPETLEVFEKALERIGHNQRGAKQFGTLLAACELMMTDAVPTDQVADNLVRGLDRDSLYEYESADPMWLLVWRHILSAQPEPWRKNDFPTVAEVIRDWLAADNQTDMTRIQRKLNRVGLAIVQARNGHTFLAIPPRHQQLQAMFRDSDFRAHGGEGAWTGVLRGAPKYDPDTREGVMRVDKVPQLGGIKCTQIRLNAEIELGGMKAPIFHYDPDAEAPDVDEAA